MAVAVGWLPAVAYSRRIVAALPPASLPAAAGTGTGGPAGHHQAASGRPAPVRPCVAHAQAGSRSTAAAVPALPAVSFPQSPARGGWPAGVMPSRTYSADGPRTSVGNKPRQKSKSQGRHHASKKGAKVTPVGGGGSSRSRGGGRKAAGGAFSSATVPRQKAAPAPQAAKQARSAARPPPGGKAATIGATPSRKAKPIQKRKSAAGGEVALLYAWGGRSMVVLRSPVSCLRPHRIFRCTRHRTTGRHGRQ
eukprot:COSAG01_NODE_4577_length_4906_cov_91.659455_5_plen_250_part_00